MKRLIVAAWVIALASPALAHVDPAEHGAFMAGLTHPLLGADHVLAMVAVGLLAVILRGRAMLMIPASFVGLMAAGFALALAGGSLPLVEPVILASGVALGGLVLAAFKLRMAAATAVVGFFGLFHGFAHGAEIGAAAAFPFALGFICATAALHASGVAVAVLLSRTHRGNHGVTAVRVLGGMTTLAALALGVA